MHLNPKMKALLKKAQPWVIYGSIFLILRYSGLMAGITDATHQAFLMTGAMDASIEAVSPKKTFNYDFTVLDANQKSVDMSQYKGKTIFLNLWATWCGPCRAEMPAIQSLYNKIDHERVVFIMLSLDQQERFKKVSAYFSKQNFTLPVFYPENGLPELLQVRSIPSTFVISPKGEVVFSEAGTANYDTEKFKSFLENQSATIE